MNLFKSIPLEIEGTKYELRILFDDTTINFVTFRNNFPANGYRHQVILPKNCDVSGLMEKYPFEELIEASKTDIIERNWEKLYPVIQECHG